MNAKRLENQYDELEKENQEKHHKIEARIASEGFVGWTVPINSEEEMFQLIS